MTSPENPSGATPQEQQAAAAMLDLFATTVGNADIFGPGTNVEPPIEQAPTDPPKTTGQ